MPTQNAHQRTPANCHEQIYKGWIQTALVHMHSPRRLLGDLGPVCFGVTQLLLIGMVVSPLVHPFLLVFTVWAVISGVTPGEPDPAASVVAGFGAVVFITGYAATFASQLKGIRERGLGDLSSSVASMPLYWLLISAAAWAGVWEFLRRPHYWNKTEHGLSIFHEGEQETG